MGLEVAGEGKCWDGRCGQPGCTRCIPMRHSITTPLAAPLARWFYFRAANLDTTREITFEILNAGAVSFPDGFDDYNVCSSSDGQDWIRVPATFENGKSLAWTLVPPQRALYFVSACVFRLRPLWLRLEGFFLSMASRDFPLCCVLAILIFQNESTGLLCAVPAATARRADCRGAVPARCQPHRPGSITGRPRHRLSANW